MRTRTLKILNSFREVKLLEPEIQPLDGGILVTLYKVYLNVEQLKKLELNDRQIKVVEFVKEQSKITNKEYQELNTTSERTASRYLNTLVKKNILRHSEIKGAGPFYFLV